MSSSPSLRRFRAALVAAVILVTAVTAAAVPFEDDRASDDLERVAVRSMAAVVRVEVHLPIVAVLDGDRRIAVRDEVRLTGTGFGVGPREIVTARPLVEPSNVAILADLRSRQVPGIDGVSEDARPVRGTPRVTVTGAELQTSADFDPGASRAVVVTVDDADSSELALLRTEDIGPYLPVRDDQTRGSTTVAVGFGDRPGTIPVLRRLTFDVEARVTGRPELALVALSGTITRGDIGAPVLGRDGAVHGVVFSRGGTASPPLAARASAVIGLVPKASQTGDNPFGVAMDRMWSGDYAAAAAALGQATTRAPSALVEAEMVRAQSLTNAHYEVVSHGDRWRIPLIIVGLAAFSVSMLILRHLRHEDLSSR